MWRIWMQIMYSNKGRVEPNKRGGGQMGTVGHRDREPSGKIMRTQFSCSTLYTCFPPSTLSV